MSTKLKSNEWYFGLNDFFSNLSSSVAITHFWPLIGHWEVAALVLVCKNISNIILKSLSSTTSQLWEHLARLNFLKESKFRQEASHEASSDELESLFQSQLYKRHKGDSFAMFQYQLFECIRTDGVYAQQIVSEYDPNKFRIFRFHHSCFKVAVIHTKFGPSAVVPLLKKSILDGNANDDSSSAHVVEIAHVHFRSYEPNELVLFPVINPITKLMELVTGIFPAGKHTELRLLPSNFSLLSDDDSVHDFIDKNIVRIFQFIESSKMLTSSCDMAYFHHDRPFPWARASLSDDLFA